MCVCIIYSTCAFIHTYIKMKSLGKHARVIEVLHFCVSSIFIHCCVCMHMFIYSINALVYLYAYR